MRNSQAASKKCFAKRAAYIEKQSQVGGGFNFLKRLFWFAAGLACCYFLCVIISELKLLH